MTEGAEHEPAKTRLEEIREQRVAALERDGVLRAEEDAFLEAFERRQTKRIESSETVADKARGAPDPVVEAERARIRAVIARDRLERRREMDREMAELEVRDGVFVNLSDTVIEPTPEWIAKGETEPYTPKQPEGTVRTLSTLRRVMKPVPSRMHAKGKITDEQRDACLWYRDRYEAAGLIGRFKSTHISLTGGGSGGGDAQSPMALHEYEAEARAEFRAARAALTAFYLVFFDAVTLHDIPISRAWRFAKSPKHKAETRFKMVAQELANFRDWLKNKSDGPSHD